MELLSRNEQLLIWLQKKRRFTHFISYFLLLCVLTVTNCYASSPYYFFPILPRININGSTVSRTYQEEDAILPVYGNSNFIVFASGAGRYGNDRGWFIGPGLGTRAILGHHIWGAYLFGDRDVVPRDSSGFWVLNPGIEIFGRHWEWHANGYAPTRRDRVIRTAFGDEIGIGSGVHFTGHSEFDHLFQITDSIGPGFDTSLGFSVLPYNALYFYGGFYFYQFRGIRNIEGGQFGARYYFNHNVAIAINDSVDTVFHNSFGVS
ncbi:MAG: hypothetical protein AAGG80_05780, partial [Pseudomonadota bacterium]